MVKIIERDLTEDDLEWLNEPFSTSGAIAAVRSLMKRHGEWPDEPAEPWVHPEVALRRDPPDGDE